MCLDNSPRCVYLCVCCFLDKKGFFYSKTLLLHIFFTNLPSYNVVGEFVIRKSVIRQSNMHFTIKLELKSSQTSTQSP